jgi:hypothetical protein
LQGRAKCCGQETIQDQRRQRSASVADRRGRASGWWRPVGGFRRCRVTARCCPETHRWQTSLSLCSAWESPARACSHCQYSRVWSLCNGGVRLTGETASP